MTAQTIVEDLRARLEEGLLMAEDAERQALESPDRVRIIEEFDPDNLEPWEERYTIVLGSNGRDDEFEDGPPGGEGPGGEGPGGEGPGGEGPDQIFLFRDTFYDDGEARFTVYMAGDPSLVGRVDVQNAYSWQWAIIEYEAPGILAAAVRLTDVGRLIVTEYVDGIRSEVTVFASEDIDGATPLVISNYDENGDLARREVFRDNGLSIATEFQDGAAVSRLQTDIDDAFTWDTREFFFDDAGRVDVLNVTFDNGRSVSTLYDDAGNFALRGVWDDADEFVWDRQIILYREDGSRDAIATGYDDGRERVVFYDDDGNVEAIVWGDYDPDVLPDFLQDYEYPADLAEGALDARLLPPVGDGSGDGGVPIPVAVATSADTFDFG